MFQYVHVIQGCYSAALHCCCCSVSQCNEVRCEAPSLLISSFLVDFYYCCVKELKCGLKLYPFSKDLVFQCQVVYLGLGPHFQLDTGEAFCSPPSLSWDCVACVHHSCVMVVIGSLACTLAVSLHQLTVFGYIDKK